MNNIGKRISSKINVVYGRKALRVLVTGKSTVLKKLGERGHHVVDSNILLYDVLGL